MKNNKIKVCYLLFYIFCTSIYTQKSFAASSKLELDTPFINYISWVSHLLKSTSDHIHQYHEENHHMWLEYSNQPLLEKEWSIIKEPLTHKKRVAVLVHGHCFEYLVSAIHRYFKQETNSWKKAAIDLLYEKLKILPDDLKDLEKDIIQPENKHTYGLREVRHLARFLSEYSLPSGEKRYDTVLGYNYIPAVRLSTLGTQFANECQSMLKNVVQVDIFAHSMGGLVSRYALEKEHLLSEYPKYSNLITFGTPHLGVPWRIIDLISTDPSISTFDMLTGPDYKSKQSEFLKELNDEDDTYSHLANYYTFSGYKFSDLTSRYHPDNPPEAKSPTNIGVFLQYIYQKFSEPDAHTDGLISVQSAIGKDALIVKSSRYKEHIQNHTAILYLNHRTIVGSSHLHHPVSLYSENCPQCVISRKLESWMSHWDAL